MTKLRVSPTGLLAVLLAGLIGASVMVTAQSGGPVLAPAVVVGPSVTFNWTAVPGATAYVLRAGATPGNYQIAVNVGLTLTAAATAPAVGTYYARVEAITASGTLPSNEVPVVVTSLIAPPATPTELGAFVNGTTALLAWTPGTGGGSPTQYVLHAGTSSGGTEAGIFPLALGTQLAVPNVTPGTYYLRLFAVNAAGASPASNEAVLVMPAGGGCSAPPARSFTAAAFGTYVQFSWAGVPGAAGYRLDFSEVAGGPVTYSQGIPANRTRFDVTGAPLGTFYGKLVTAFSCGSQSAGPEVAFTIDGAPPPGPRAANPPAGQRLPLPNMTSVVQQLSVERRDLINQSCLKTGGNLRFMFELVRRLRAIDNRWGLNWKRGLVGDISEDIVDYNFGSESDEGTRNVYIIDVIGNHCPISGSPTWAWIDQTEATRAAGSRGVWTLMPYIQAGYPIVSDQQ
jgi:hypothetical protein